MTRELTAKSACHDRSSRSSRTTCTNQDSLDDKTDDSQDKVQKPSKEKDKRKMVRYLYYRLMILNNYLMALSSKIGQCMRNRVY